MKNAESKQVLTVPKTPVAQKNGLSFIEQTEQRADRKMKACVMWLKSEIVPVQRKDEKTEGIRDLGSNVCPLGRSSEKKLPADFLF